MVAAAAIGAAVVGAGATAYASNQASGAQQDAASSANRTALAQYNQTRQDLAPYNQAGQSALNNLMALSGGGGSKLQMQTLENMPGYQFALQQGLKATQNSAAARGLGSSGAALRGAMDYGTGLAQSNYGQYYNQLMGQAQLGENAAAQTGAYGTQTAQSMGQNTIGAGNAAAAGYLGTANGINNALNSGVQGYYANQLLAQNQNPAANGQNYGIGGMYGPAMTP